MPMDVTSDGQPLSWGRFTDPFLDDLTRWIDGRRVLETFAGNGLLAARLRLRGVEIRPTTLFAGHDGHDRGMHAPVEEMSAVEAVKAHGADSDVLLMSWPTATEGAFVATLEWGPERPVVFVGEVSRTPTDYAGCASDAFFETTREVHAFPSYESRNTLEAACVRVLDRELLKGWLDRSGAQGLHLPPLETAPLKSEGREIALPPSPGPRTVSLAGVA